MDFDFEQLGSLGSDVKEGIGYTGGKEKYLSALQRYYRSSEANVKKVEESYAAGDLENLMITVHSMKSNSKMIGAISVSEAFEKLEIAARNKDEETIKSDLGPAMEDYKKLIEGLKPVGEMETVKAADEISGEEARKIADELLAALDDFDDDLSASLAKKLSGYPFRITQRGKLREASNLISDFMYDEAAELIREIIPEIE